jgi:ubiquinone/menaquinone biosynthesis C-methylase UbiE
MTDKRPRVDYDTVAESYDTRYDRNRYGEVRDALIRFVGNARDVVEVGCGTGHWLAELTARDRRILGLDPSWGMLKAAARNSPGAFLVGGSADELPLATVSVDRLFCFNALHHFDDKRNFVAEARRALRTQGAIMIVGLDPHTGIDQWWVYDYFPNALAADLVRYLSAVTIRELLADAGFHGIATSLAQHFPAEIPFEKALEREYLDRRSTSQLMVIADDDYRSGMDRLNAERPVIRADLRVYATIGRIG